MTNQSSTSKEIIKRMEKHHGSKVQIMGKKSKLALLGIWNISNDNRCV